MFICLFAAMSGRTRAADAAADRLNRDFQSILLIIAQYQKHFKTN